MVATETPSQGSDDADILEEAAEDYTICMLYGRADPGVKVLCLCRVYVLFHIISDIRSSAWTLFRSRIPNPPYLLVGKKVAPLTVIQGC